MAKRFLVIHKIKIVYSAVDLPTIAVFWPSLTTYLQCPHRVSSYQSGMGFLFTLTFEQWWATILKNVSFKAIQIHNI
jgi:hypothetical protein